jgi:hypothetical protein
MTRGPITNPVWLHDVADPGIVARRRLGGKNGDSDSSFGLACLLPSGSLGTPLTAGGYGLTRRKNPEPLAGKTEFGNSFRAPTNVSANCASPQPAGFTVELVCSVKPDEGVVHETQ